LNQTSIGFVPATGSSNGLGYKAPAIALHGEHGFHNQWKG
jgi:hypothetical protein